MEPSNYKRIRRIWLVIVAASLLMVNGSAASTAAVFSSVTSGTPSALAAKAALSCSTTYNNQVLSSVGLTNYWPLNDTSGTTAVAALGGVNGTYTNGPVLNNAKARNSMTNASPLFDGTDDYVALIDGNDYTNTSPYTLEAWVRRTDVRTQNDPIITKETAGPRSGWSMYTSAEGSGYRLVSERWAGGGSGDLAFSSRMLELNRWYHVAVTFTPSVLGVYVDGKLEGQTSTTVSLANTTQPIYIGADLNFGSAKGNIGHVAMYNRALTAQELKDHYDGCTYSAAVRSDNPFDYWPLDEQSGTTVTDTARLGARTGLYNGAVLNQASAFPSDNSTTKRSVLLNKASNQSIDFASVPVPAVGTGQFTVEMWVRPTTSPTDFNRLYSAEWQVSGVRAGWSVFLMASGAPRCNRIDSGGGEDKTTANLTLPNGVWSHVACTYDGSTIRMYVNGALSNSVASTRSIPATTGTSYSRIGALSGQGGVYNAVVTDYFNGNIDDVSLNNTGLSAAQILKHYNAQ